ncbi:Uncharacterized protein dnl_26110 [Desulfonema limicola]|uniref:Uncharacterized protein n=1 Tax=Desulfonema limicola TaxID=45656 RepID=A0A975B7M0_9BACT|nr:hypothetical protein [Desulfonema limicola]QTA80313.1 Uncharacterized protein dnl_26110 [Desulfonema limicola]
MIKKSLLIVTSLAIIAIFSSITFGGPGGPVNEKEYSNNFYGYDGTWYDDDNFAVISIKEYEKDGFLDILGKDKASIYKCNCIIENDRAECVGDGVNYEINKRFIYKSTLKVEKDGSISEDWMCIFKDNKINGKATFRRKLGTR